jgi:hypothetical protein
LSLLIAPANNPRGLPILKYINEHPHRPSHHERTVPPSARTSNRNSPLQNVPATDDLLDPSSYLNQSPEEGFSGNFNAFVNDDDDGLEDGNDDEEGVEGGGEEGDLDGQGRGKKATGTKKAATGKRKAGAAGAGPPGKKARTKSGAAGGAATAGKKGSKK